jgi:basic amino acid/polyamine antiporter, APA family
VLTEQTPIGKQSLPKNRLLRILGVTFGVAVAIGGTIGIGILRMPGVIAAQLQNTGLIITVWVIGGLYAFAGANTYAELGTMLPLDGGPYVFARKAYGEFGGFLVGWSDWLLRTSSMTYLAVALSEYASVLFSFPSGAITAVAIAVLIFFTAFHWLGLRVASWAQNMLSFFKVLAFGVIIGSCFFFAHRSHSPAAPSPLLHSNPMLLFAAIALAFQNILGTYSGWHAPVYFSEENKDPATSIPRSLFTGVGLITAIYVLFNLAMLYALPLSKLSGSKLAAATAAQEIFGGATSQIVMAVALISLVGIINASFLFTPRVMYALSRDHLFSSRGATLNAAGTPTVALLVTASVAIALTAGSFEKLFALTAFLSVLVDAATFATLFILRRREPALARPFRARGYPLVPAIVLVGAILLLAAFIISSTQNSFYAVTGLAVSYPVYLMVKALVKKQASNTRSDE